jgi:hypothetical protein
MTDTGHPGSMDTENIFAEGWSGKKHDRWKISPG